MTSGFHGSEFRLDDQPVSLDLRSPSLRAQVFHWLANVFLAPPSVAEIAAYRHGPAANWLERLGATIVLAEGIRRMSRALSGEETDRELSARLGKVHAVLFAGLGGPATVSPYESAYSGDGRLFQAPVSEMADLLRRHGVHVSQAWSEAPDHLAVELTLIARLLAGGHGDGADLAGRLRRWLPAFAEQCAARDSSGFWSGAAQVLVALLSAGCADDQECNVFFIPLTGGNNDRRHQT